MLAWGGLWSPPQLVPDDGNRRRNQSYVTRFGEHARVAHAFLKRCISAKMSQHYRGGTYKRVTDAPAPPRPVQRTLGQTPGFHLPNSSSSKLDLEPYFPDELQVRGDAAAAAPAAKAAAAVAKRARRCA